MGKIVRLICRTAFLCVIGFAFATPGVLSQGATPVPPGNAPPTDGSPTIGSTVTYTDVEGVEHGTVTITELFDPFTDFPEDRPPENGTRYVVLYVQFEATGEASFEANPNHLVVRDADGYLWSTASVPRGDEPPMPEAQSQTMAPGNRVSGAVGFIVPADTPLAQVFYQPESGHLILLADLGADEAGTPPIGTEVTYVDNEGVEHGVVAVTELQDPFTEFGEGYEPSEGTRYVVLFVSFEATGDAAFDANPNNLLVRDAEGYLWATATVNRGSEPAMPDAQSQTLAPGNKISGAVGFIVPADTPIEQIYYQPESGHLILLVDLREG